MGAKVLGSVISCAMLSFLVIVTAAFYIFAAQEERVNDICYDYCETISTKEELSDEVFELFRSELERYGNFRIDLMLETETDDGYRDYYYGYESIVDRKLKRGDVVTVTVYCLDSSILERTVGRMVRCCAVKRAVAA